MFCPLTIVDMKLDFAFSGNKDAAVWSVSVHVNGDRDFCIPRGVDLQKFNDLVQLGKPGDNRNIIKKV